MFPSCPSSLSLTRLAFRKRIQRQGTKDRKPENQQAGHTPTLPHLTWPGSPRPGCSGIVWVPGTSLCLIIDLTRAVRFRRGSSGSGALRHPAWPRNLLVVRQESTGDSRSSLLLHTSSPPPALLCVSGNFQLFRSPTSSFAPCGRLWVELLRLRSRSA